MVALHGANASRPIHAVGADERQPYRIAFIK